MPRPLRRNLLAGYPIHVLQRGHNRADCFGSHAEHDLYLGLLQEYAKRHGCAVHAYVLMTNHMHLLVSPPDIPPLSMMMRDINRIYGLHFNRSRNRVGSVWQSRFKACLVDSDQYFLTCQRYIELNPVRAGMVEDPARYPWSSYPTNAAGRPSALVAPHALYLALGSAGERRQAAYRSLFGQAISAETLARIRGAVNRSKPLGDEEFVRKVELELAEAAEKCREGTRYVPGPVQARA
jgi:putative transposase